MATSKATAPSSLQDQVQDLTGYEEGRIESFFPSHFDELHGAMQQRALVFITKCRDGVETGAAYEQSMGLKVRDLAVFFGAGELDETPDGPETPAGEGESSSS